jgi:hypothetical protein
LSVGLGALNDKFFKAFEEVLISYSAESRVHFLYLGHGLQLLLELLNEEPIKFSAGSFGLAQSTQQFDQLLPPLVCVASLLFDPLLFFQLSVDFLLLQAFLFIYFIL